MMFFRRAVFQRVGKNPRSNIAENCKEDAKKSVWRTLGPFSITRFIPAEEAPTTNSVFPTAKSKKKCRIQNTWSSLLKTRLFFWISKTTNEKMAWTQQENKHERSVKAALMVGWDKLNFPKQTQKLRAGAGKDILLIEYTWHEVSLYLSRIYWYSR